MSIWSFIRFPFGALAAVAILFACSPNSSGIGVQPTSPTAVRRAGLAQKTFSYTGGEQTFKVPSGVKAIAIDATGAAGAGFIPKRIGRGGRIIATVPVTQGETLYVFVAGEGSSSTAGFNGGGSGGCVPSYGDCGDGGGGASDVREGGNGLSNRIVVAGGGGGEGFKRTGGGLGGGLVGGMGKGRKPSGHGTGGFGGSGGTQSAGGSGGAGGPSDGNAGLPGTLGVGGSGGQPSGLICGGGGGGGGYYGGGGGGSGSQGSGTCGGAGGGGGGGSSYAEPNAKNVQMWQGWMQAAGNGVIVFSWK